MKCNFAIKITSCRTFLCPIILLRGGSSALVGKLPEQIIFEFSPACFSVVYAPPQAHAQNLQILMRAVHVFLWDADLILKLSVLLQCSH